MYHELLDLFLSCLKCALCVISSHQNRTVSAPGPAPQSLGLQGGDKHPPRQGKRACLVAVWVFARVKKCVCGEMFWKTVSRVNLNAKPLFSVTQRTRRPGGEPQDTRFSDEMQRQNHPGCLSRLAHRGSENPPVRGERCEWCQSAKYDRW